MNTTKFQRLIPMTVAALCVVLPGCEGDGGAEPSDAGHNDGAAEDASLDADGTESATCELMPDGSCSPPGDNSGPDCVGCWPLTGHPYDVERACFIGTKAVTFACGTACTCGTAEACYMRKVGSSIEVYYSDCTYFDVDQPGFKETWGIERCDFSLFATMDMDDQCDGDNDAGPGDAGTTDDALPGG